MMIRRAVITSGLLLILVLLLITPALAGGWAVITLDQWPGQVTAGEPLTVGFTVRQHGRTPMDGLTPNITGRNTETGERVMVSANPEGATGHYTATVTFPEAGTWEWTIQAFTMDQPMPPLTVVAGQPAEGSEIASLPSPVRFPLPLWAGVLGLALAAAGAALTRRRTARWAPALLVAGLAVSVLGFVAAAVQPSNSQPVALAAPSLTQEQLGQNLFLAKGCATCHSHEAVRNQGSIIVDVGPDLSRFSASPEYLHQWLQDPASIRPGTAMPDLELSEAEIEALVAFINSE